MQDDYSADSGAISDVESRQARKSARVKCALGKCLLTLVAADAGAAAPSQVDLSSSEAPDRYTWFVGDQFVYDDNVFRLPTKYISLPGFLAPTASRQDHIETVSIGTDDHFQFMRQSVAFEAQIAANYFARNTFLDNASGSGDAIWNWEFGDRLSGDAGIDYLRQLANSEQTLFYGKDLVSNTVYYGDASYLLNPDWHVNGGVRTNETSNSAIQVQINNFHSKSGNVGIEYGPTDGDKIGWEYRYTDARAIQNPAETGLNYRTYNENTTRVSIEYTIAPKTVVDAYYGYLKRSYPGTTPGAFSGDIWRAGFTWDATEKTRVNVQAWRDLEAYFDAQSNYFVSKGESISPTWIVTSKLQLNGTLLWVKQDYIASNPSFYVLGGRQDSAPTRQVNAIYNPTRAVSVTMGYDHEHRSSTQAFFNYEDRLWTLSVRITF